MFKIKHKGIYPLFLILELLLVIQPNTNVNAASLAGTVYSYPADPIPSVDGIFSAGEWTVAGAPVDIKLLDLYDQYAPHIVVGMRSVYSEDNILFLALAIPDSIVDPNDELIIAFNSSNTPLALNPATFGISFDDDHDAKQLFIQNNDYLDGYTEGIGYRIGDDVGMGGVNDGEGKAVGNGTHVNVEFKIPFDSGDTHGYDIKLSVGDDEEIFIVYKDGDNEKTYSQWLVETNDYDYGRIHIGAPVATSIPLWIVPIALTSLFAIITIIKKRK
ncbi:MAG: hypothetical protein EAX90_08725 [Candidatus Heimdallarchaeota archaeon]|nr:hypothetical protein [Candidatus Heimdallarchaeota archaeon]